MIYICIPSVHKVLQCEDIPKSLEELRDYGWDFSEDDFVRCLNSKEASSPVLASKSFDNLLTKMYVNCLNTLDFTKQLAISNNKTETKNYKNFLECLKD